MPAAFLFAQGPGQTVQFRRHLRVFLIPRRAKSGDDLFVGRAFDGETEIGLFPGDLPADPSVVFTASQEEYGVTTLRFRPGRVERSNQRVTLSLPHIRLDRVLQYLVGDRLQ